MTTVSANISAALSATYAAAASPVSSVDQTVVESQLVQLAGGTGLGFADRLYAAPINIAASGTTTINLTTALDAFGNGLAMLKVKAIYLESDPTNVNDIVLSGGASNPFVGPLAGTTPSVATRPGGVTLLANNVGWTVVPSTGDQIKLANSSGTTAVTGTLVLVGASA
jgi:hypothetical protein